MSGFHLQSVTRAKAVSDILLSKYSLMGLGQKYTHWRGVNPQYICGRVGQRHSAGRYPLHAGELPDPL